MQLNSNHLGMILKGYPRISETFISREILLLESLGIPIRIFSLRQPREDFSHEHVKEIQASVSYMPEYVLPHWRRLLESNRLLWKRLGSHYMQCLSRAILRACERKKTATVRHFLQAGHLAATELLGSPVKHLHAHFCHTPTSVAYFASELTGLPFSFTAHAKDIYTSEPEQLARQIHRAEFVVTCTEYNARYLRRLLNGKADAPPIYTVYHGIELEFFQFAPHPAPFPPYRILSIGRLVAKKGYDDLLKALSLLARSDFDFRFTHIGSGEDGAQIKALAHELGLSSKVEFLGTLPHEEVLAHYRSAHVFALACKVAENGDRDGIPNVLAEAMAVGLPVVTTEISAIPELVEDGITGRLVPPGKPAAMAEAIREVLLQPEEPLRRAGQARKRVEAHFDNRQCVKQLHALFQKALAGP